MFSALDLVVHYKGTPILWDYRQNWTPGAAVFVRASLTPDQRQRLLAKFPQAKVFYEQEEASFSELVAESLAYPSRKLKLVGVTGSNGKSSTCLYGAELCSLMGRTSAVIGSLGVLLLRKGSAQIEETIDTGFTSPDSPQLQLILKDLVQRGVEIVFMEVSSHALDLDRIGGTAFDAAAFLNLTQDHLDFHKTMDEYYKAKSLLFSKYLPATTKSSPFALINTSDAWGVRLAQESSVLKNLRCVSLEQELRIESRSLSGMQVSTKSGEIFKLPLYGDFNAGNFYIAAQLARHVLDAPLKGLLEKATEILPARGRMEPVEVEGVGLSVVDYAHTPDALEKALGALRFFVPSGGRLITVFGCGGDRDPTKRPLMGAIAARLSDFVIVTSDNPRTEDPQSILQDILQGMKGVASTKYLVEVDRRAAIRIACQRATNQDVILVAGKGHETYQIIGTHKAHFDDVEELLNFSID